MISSYSISLSLSSSFKTNNQNISLPLINTDTPNDEENVIYFNFVEYVQSFDDNDNIDDPFVPIQVFIHME